MDLDLGFGGVAWNTLVDPRVSPICSLHEQMNCRFFGLFGDNLQITIGDLFYRQGEFKGP